MMLVPATVLLCALLTGSIDRVFCWDTTLRDAAGGAGMTTLALLLLFGSLDEPSHADAAALPAFDVALAAPTASRHTCRAIKKTPSPKQEIGAFWALWMAWGTPHEVTTGNATDAVEAPPTRPPPP